MSLSVISVNPLIVAAFISGVDIGFPDKTSGPIVFILIVSGIIVNVPFLNRTTETGFLTVCTIPEIDSVPIRIAPVNSNLYGIILVVSSIVVSTVVLAVIRSFNVNGIASPENTESSAYNREK